jgi:hypothetical protein
VRYTDDMSEMVFEDQKDEFGPPPSRAEGFDLTGMLVRRGVAPDRTQAEYILIGLAIAAVVIGAVVWFYHASSRSVTQAQVDAAMRGAEAAADSQF